MNITDIGIRARRYIHKDRKLRAGPENAGRKPRLEQVARFGIREGNYRVKLRHSLTIDLRIDRIVSGFYVEADVVEARNFPGDCIAPVYPQTLRSKGQYINPVERL